MKKKGLVEVFGPYTMLQAFWIALHYKEYEWDIVLRYVDGKEESLERLRNDCQEANLFSRIIIFNESNTMLPKFEKIRLAAKTVFSCVTFQKKKMFKKDIERVVGTFDYDIVCVSNSFSIFGCELLAFSDEIETIMLEDGVWDYYFQEVYADVLTNIAGNLFFYWGIYNFKSKKNFKLNKNCIKYLTIPERRTEDNFKRIEKMFDESKGNEEYYELCKKLYCIDDCNYDIVIFTCPRRYLNRVTNENYYMIKWFEENYPNKKILLKRHPRDNYDYKSDICQFVDRYKTVPGELLLQYLKNSIIFFAIPSTIMLTMKEDEYDYKVFKFSVSIVGEEDEVTFNNLVDKLHIPEDRVIYIDQ